MGPSGMTGDPASGNGQLRPALPAAGSTRWQPIRGGLLNIYRYDYEEFRYEQGHLLLRGDNGTGKSRVLALQLPFLLDGETAPHRLEPDGDTAKRIEWNLLLGKHQDRLGYTWLEFGRRDDDGGCHYLTLGAGLRAVEGRGTGSGGEKAIALTIPQFAAAAAHYRTADPLAPRLILLDEAFVGIDKTMRAQCMRLLRAFDLDFVMTSEQEWGCYATLPGVAIYHLSTRPGIDAVGVTRWVWNGQGRSLDTGRLPGAAPPDGTAPPRLLAAGDGDAS